MRDTLTDLIYRARENYLNLQALQPNHELLRYFIINEKGFVFNPDREVKVEFINRFGRVDPKEFKTFSDFENALIQKKIWKLYQCFRRSYKKVYRRIAFLKLKVLLDFHRAAPTERFINIDTTL